jgi:hypothetical protein
MQTGTAADDAALNDVFSSERDRGGNSAPPVETQEPAPQEAAPQLADQQVDTDDSDETPVQGRDDKGRFVPVSELVAERKKLRAKIDEEARLRIEAETRAKVYEEQFKSFGQRQQPVQQQPAPQPEPQPDPLMEPEQFARWQSDQFQKQILNDRLNFSEEMARDKFGDQVVDAAVEAARRAGVVSRFLTTRNPYRELVTWHKNMLALEKIGPDPDVYEKTVEERVKARLLEDLKAGKLTATGQPAPAQRFPGSLADATSAGAQGAHLSDEAMMGGIFNSERQRK